MSNTLKYNDITTFHPGYYVAEIIDNMHISQAEFAMRMGTTAKTLSQLINGQANISNDLAKKISLMTGTSIDLWLELQSSYNKKLIEIEQAKDIDEQKDLVKEIDYKYFIENADLPATKCAEEKITNLCKYLKISDLRILNKSDFLLNLGNTSNNNDILFIKNIICSKMWIQTAINKADSIKTKPYDSRSVKAYLPKLRRLSVTSPKEFIPIIKKAFASFGIALVILPHLKNSEIDGFVKWIDDDKVVLAMSNKHMDANYFWYSLFYEIKYVLLQKVKTVFIKSDNKSITELDVKLAKQLDEFAKNNLIKPTDYKAFSSTQKNSDVDIIAFADRIGVHPGIVAGRMKQDNLITKERYTKLNENYMIVYEMMTNNNN